MGGWECLCVLLLRSGGSDANVLNKLGIETLVCTSGYEEPHTKSEYIPKKELENLFSLVLELITL